MVERVVSLAPSATAIIRELDAGDLIVGRTNHSSGSGDSVGGWLTPDLTAIDALDPDVIITTDALQEEIATTLRAAGYETLHLEATKLVDVYENIRQIGDTIGRQDDARRLVSTLTRRFEMITSDAREKSAPVVYCEEWQEPPMVAGNWVPELIKIVGGRYPFLNPGQRSRPIEQSTVEAAAPDHVVLHICGAGTAVDPASIADRGWEIPAIRAGNIHVINDSLLNQPNHRLLDGAEALYEAIHGTGRTTHGHCHSR